MINVVEAEPQDGSTSPEDKQMEEVDRGALDSPPPGILKKHNSYDIALEQTVESKSDEPQTKSKKKE